MSTGSVAYELGRGSPGEGKEARRFPFPIAPEEGWLTAGLLAFVLLATAWSVEQAEWVRDLPSLSLTILLAAGVALALAKIRLSPLFLQPAGFLLGFGWVFWQASTLITQGSWLDRLRELFLRLELFLQAARKGDISVDILPFVFFLLLLTWLVGYLSSWFVFRSHGVWAALIPSGLAILTNLSYLPEQFTGYFFFYLLGGMLLAMRLHLVSKRRQWAAYRASYPKWLGAFLLNDAFWLSIIILIIAWQLPTRYVVIDPLKDTWITVRAPIERLETEMGRLFATLPSKKPLPMYTFGRTLPFRGSVALGNEVALTVEATSGGYWKAKTYDEYTLQGWVSSKVETHPLGWEPKDSPRRDYRKRREIAQKVTLNIPSGVLFAAGDIRKANIDANIQVLPPGSPGASPNPPDVVAVESLRQLKPRSVYEVVSSRAAASVEDLRTAGTDYPAWVRSRYLQLPEALPQRVRRLSMEIAQGVTNPYDKAAAIEAYLRTIPYSLDIEPPAFKADGVDHFLFNLHKGYSDYYASAMAVMLRAVGVPARVAVGYNIGERDTEKGVFIVRENDSHAWPEVFFPGYGWVEFEPTSILPSISRGEEAFGEGGAQEEMSLEEDIFFSGEEFFEKENFFATPPGGAGFSLATYVRPAGYSLAGLLLLFLLALLAWWLSLVFVSPSHRPYVGMLRLGWLARRGLKPQQTPNEYAETLSGALPPYTQEIRTITDSYAKTRYGSKSLTEEEQQGLRKAWAKLRLGLLGLVVKRKGV